MSYPYKKRKERIVKRKKYCVGKETWQEKEQCVILRHDRRSNKKIKNTFPL